MIKNIIKVLAAIVLGYILGFAIGRMFGGILGSIASILFTEIISSNQTALASMMIAILSGGIVGYIATEAGRKIFEFPDHPILGIMLGSVISVIFLVNHGVIQIPDPDISNRLFYRIPILYGATVGHYIGTILFPFIGIRGIVYEEMETRKRIKANAESKNDLSFYKSSKTDENR